MTNYIPKTAPDYYKFIYVGLLKVIKIKTVKVIIYPKAFPHSPKLIN